MKDCKKNVNILYTVVPNEKIQLFMIIAQQNQEWFKKSI